MNKKIFFFLLFGFVLGMNQNAVTEEVTLKELIALEKWLKEFEAQNKEAIEAEKERIRAEEENKRLDTCLDIKKKLVEERAFILVKGPRKKFTGYLKGNKCHVDDYSIANSLIKDYNNSLCSN